MDKIKKRIKDKKQPDILGYILLGIFILLLAFVIFLLFRLKDVKWEYNHSKVDFIMPIIEEKLNTIEVNIGGKKKNETVNYTFNITNYRDKKVNKEDYKYKFYVNSTAEADYKLSKKGDKKNILDENNISEFLTIKGKKKEIITYKLNIKLKADQPEKNVIYLYVEGKK